MANRATEELPPEATVRVVDDAAVDAYATWSRSRAPAITDPYYSETTVRFDVREDDVLRSVGDIEITPSSCGVALGSARARAHADVCGLTDRDARAAVAAIDGTRTARQARVAAGLRDEAWQELLRHTFGILIFAPGAVDDLERRVSGADIVRYPGSPYEIVRAYWENMAAVAGRLAVARDEIASPGAFIRFLRELNVLALVGASGRVFYFPASPIVGKVRIVPGEVWTAAAVVEPRHGGDRFVSGPRVNASPIGGPWHSALLSTAVDEREAGGATGDFADESGLSWGRIVLARADHDAQAAPWFCPPRPIDTRHFEALRVAYSDALDASRAGRSAETLRLLALVHWRFVRLHPFRAGNQCLAMSLVNHVLRRSHGAGIPHLVLDHLALGLSAEAYARAFAVAVAAWIVPEKDPLERYLELVRRKERCFGFLQALTSAPDLRSAAALVEDRPGDARLAIIPPKLATSG